ncbi:hypothetical protein VTN00DRAFT_2246 [Thermoascus crustaceus]|uniref:uncharacterized protein n=1 Tax=Thermoascus crustaceus TaxID=5088 RepID=UPI003743626C
MAPRRSARLRGRTPSVEVQEPKPASPVVEKLSSVEESDETPEVVPQPNNEGVPSTPRSRSKRGDNAAVSSQTKSPVAKTPTTVGDVRPAHEEMHPSKARPSTTKQPDTGLILGFNPVKRDSEGNIIKESIIENTPTKTKSSPPSQLGTPSFFKFSCQDSQLSEEARKLMDNIREDVSRIKAQMVLDKGKQDRKEREAERQYGDRKIAQPKGKADRFTDAHMAEFKKMDSIENHPSAFRALPGRFQPVNKPLKRKSSKADLDEPEKRQAPAKSTGTPSRIPAPPAGSVAKRVKQSEGDDTSTNRPKNDGDASTKPVNERPKTIARSSLMTPTRASASRAATVKLSKTSKIPTLTRSPMSKPTATPRTPQTDFNPKLKSNIPSLANLKSILRRHQPLFSNDPAKIAAGTHVPSSSFNPDIHMRNLPGTSFEDSVNQTPSPKKRVVFTPNTKSPNESAQASPSPSKEHPETSTAVSDVVYPTLPAITPEKEKKDTKPAPGKVTPTIRHVRESGVSSNMGPFPNLLAVPHGINNKKRRRDDVDDEKDIENIPPNKDSSSEERSSKRVKPNTPVAPKVAVTPTPLKTRPIAKSATPGPGTPSRAGTPGTARQKSKGVLSMSRLNMLARPKERR